MDHRLLTAALHLRLHLQRTRGTATPRPPDTDKLHDPVYANCYAVEVANRFAALDDVNEMDDLWNQITSPLTPVAMDVLGP